MAVAVDATGTKVIFGNPVTSWSNNALITVGSGVNRALVVTLALGSSGSTSAWAATWDSGGSNQAMTVLISKVTGSANSAVIFGLRNPTPGNKTLALSWTGSEYPSIDAISFTGVEQSSDANAFAHAISGTTSSLTVTSATGDMAFAMIACSTITSFSQTSLYVDTTSAGADSAASYAAGAASVTFSGSGASGSIATCGIDIVAASTGGSILTVSRKKLIYRRAA